MTFAIGAAAEGGELIAAGAEAWGAESGGEAAAGGAGWGDEGGEEPDETFRQHEDLGHGNHMSIDPEVWRALLHRPEVIAAITARANSMCADANSLSVVGGHRHGDLYMVTVQNMPTTTRARARVRPIDFWGILDDAKYSTLLKAKENYPSDPIPSFEGAGDSGSNPEPQDFSPPPPQEEAPRDAPSPRQNSPAPTRTAKERAVGAVKGWFRRRMGS